MRVGQNPIKNQVLVDENYTHQVIIPVHLPSEEGYFKDGLQILKLCLDSLMITSHDKTFITVVCNDCSIKVIEYISHLYALNNVHEVIFTNGIGKINAILKGLAGQNCPIVTISDADVLFLNGWQKATYDVFNAFPKAGAVCTTPSSKVLKQSTDNIYFDFLFSKKMQFETIVNPNAMMKFAESIGNPDFYNANQLKYNLIIQKNNCKAIVGAGHFVATYNRNIFKKPKAIFSNKKIGNDLQKFIDEPVLTKGYYRLSTVENFTYHMGNMKEDWMEKTIKALEKHDYNYLLPKLETQKNNYFKRVLVKITFRIISNKNIWKLFLRLKGLTKEVAKQY